MVEVTQTFTQTLPVLNFPYLLASRSAVVDFAKIDVETGSKRVANHLQEVIKFSLAFSIYFLLHGQHSLRVFGSSGFLSLRY